MIQREDERRLVQALVARDRDAWQRFVEQFQGLVHARVERTAWEYDCRLNRADLEDICAEVFSRLVANDFSSLRRFEGRSSLATWLAVVTRRIAVRCLQKARGRAHAGADREDGPAAADPVPGNALAALVDAEDADRVHRLLGRLNEADESVLRMFYLDDLSYAEISQRLRISINTVGPKLQRAQKRLRQLMDLEDPA